MLLVTRPYASLAERYDSALGLEFFRRVRRCFEELQRRYRFVFGSAADVGCGTGLFARYLASRWNVPVYAVDRSREMLAQTSGRCRGYSVQCLLQDARELRLPGRTDLITANYDVINHLLHPADVRAALRRVSDNLTPRGWFYFDAMSPCQVLPQNRWNVWRRATAQGEIQQRILWDGPREVMLIEVLSRKPGSPDVDVESHKERLYDPASICHWLREAGFSRVFMHDEATGRPAVSCAPRMVFLASKSEG